MTANFDELGFIVAAECVPDTCTICQFWLTDMGLLKDGVCFLTGHTIPLLNGEGDRKVMEDCPILQLKHTDYKNIVRIKKEHVEDILYIQRQIKADSET